jgi:hypothetical protein
MERDRRDFFVKLGRLSCISAILGGSGYLIAQKRIRLSGCGEDQFCKNCQKFQNCNLQPARELKNTAPINTIPNNKP